MGKARLCPGHPADLCSQGEVICARVCARQVHAGLAAWLGEGDAVPTEPPWGGSAGTLQAELRVPHAHSLWAVWGWG